MVPGDSGGFKEKFSSVDEDDGKLHVFPGEIPAKRFVFLRWGRRRWEMTTRVGLVVEVLTRVFQRVWVNRWWAFVFWALPFKFFLCLLVFFRLSFGLILSAFEWALLYGLCPLNNNIQMEKKRNSFVKQEKTKKKTFFRRGSMSFHLYFVAINY